jgi:4-amino-4-deoxy-L-arabinose transferase-like glycosyltransferase
MISLLLLTGLLLNLTVQPVFLEEPRRAIVAMEMMKSGNYINPTFLGQAYTMKPPLLNWVLILSQYLFRDPVLALRLPTVLSLLAMAVGLGYAGRRYVSPRFGWLTGLSVVASNGFLFYFSILGEIDLFYAWITVLLFLSVFHFFEQKQFLRLFLFAYLFGALGFLTKGFPSLVFLGLSIPIPFLLGRKIRSLISLKHLAGILLFTLILGSYFYLYEKNMDSTRLVEGIWSQASDRTLLKNEISKLFNHLLLFPVETLLNLFPGILLTVFLFKRNIRTHLMENRFIRYTLILFLVHFLVYWISPGSRQRYIYMLYPLLILPGIYLFEKSISRLWQHRFLQVIAVLLCLFLTAVSIGLNFIPEFKFLPYLALLSAGLAIATSILAGLSLRFPKYSFHWILMAFAVARIGFDLTALPERNHRGAAFEEKQLAYTIHDLVQDEQLYIYRKGMISMTTLYYLNLLRDDVIQVEEHLEKAHFWIVRQELLEDFTSYQKLIEIDFNNTPYLLVITQEEEH